MLCLKFYQNFNNYLRENYLKPRRCLYIHLERDVAPYFLFHFYVSFRCFFFYVSNASELKCLKTYRTERLVLGQIFDRKVTKMWFRENYLLAQGYGVSKNFRLCVFLRQTIVYPEIFHIFVWICQQPTNGLFSQIRKLL